MNLIGNLSRRPNREGGIYNLYFSSNGESSTHILWKTEFNAYTDQEAIELGKEKLTRQLKRFIECIQEAEIDSCDDQSNQKLRI